MHVLVMNLIILLMIILTLLLTDNVYDGDTFAENRNSKDTIVNTWGRKLLTLCKIFNFHVLNGRKANDVEGEFTFIGPMGSSVVDYVIAATNLFNDIVYFEVLPSVESYHLPICWSLNTILNKSNHGSQYNHGYHDNEMNNMDTHTNIQGINGTIIITWTIRIRIVHDYNDEFNSHLNSNSCLEILQAAKDCIKSNCDLAIELLTQVLQVCQSYAC